LARGLETRAQARQLGGQERTLAERRHDPVARRAGDALARDLEEAATGPARLDREARERDLAEGRGAARADRHEEDLLGTVGGARPRVQERAIGAEDRAPARDEEEAHGAAL
jgi:hypothetical protein